MRETVVDFINRAVTDTMNIRVEANDMLPIIGTKAEVIDKVEGLYFMDFALKGFNDVTITATYHAC